jgi:glycosyltransferase involved in cell wall biosynthesis
MATNPDGPPSAAGGAPAPDATPAPLLLIATNLREEGRTGVQTHVSQLRRYLAEQGTDADVITPFSWGRPLTPVFGFRLALERCGCRAASVVWYRRSHEMFLHRALRRALREAGECVVYAQEPLAARAALQARRGPHQRVVLAVHFRTSQADEWANMGMIKPGGTVFRSIRQVEREVIPQVDGLMYVSEWARQAVLGWLPEAAAVPATVIDNFVASPAAADPGQQPLGDLVTMGGLEPVKNHRYLLEILAEAGRAGRRLTLDVYGDGLLRQDLHRQAISLELESQVRFRGFQPHAREFLPHYRAYVHTSVSESSSLAIIEAMAAGLPIVAAATGPIAELFDDGIEGRCWPLDDPAAAAAILIGLLDSEPSRQKAATAARERFRRDFDADVLVPRLQSFLLGSPAALT